MYKELERNLFPNIDEDVEFMPLLSLEDEQEGEKEKYAEIIPILPLRNTVLFPGVVIPITVGRDKSIKAVKESYNGDKIIGVVSQKDSSVEEPEIKDINNVGTIARIVKMLKMPDGSTTAIIQGKKRFRIKEVVSNDPYMKAKITLLHDIKPDEKNKEFTATIASMKDLATQIIKLSPNIPSEAALVLRNINSPSFLVNFISSNLNVELTDKQKILELDDLKQRADMVLKFMNTEIQLLELKNKIQTKVRTDIDKQQREYFLHQQMKTIQEELGGSQFDQELKTMKEKATKKKWSNQVAEVFNRELEKVQRMNPASAEYSVYINYLELMLDLPWGEYTPDNFDLNNAKEVLEKDHYGLEKIKERILEYLAVLKLKGDMKSPILCFIGPPGVGKTSLGQSIATALDRKYVRMSLGGLHDEAEIRGHRKTYIGAMPGRIIQSLKKVQSSNPVFVLDEVDKIGADFRGNPAFALLEVLDPQQNNTFYDNYLELEYDLSKILFIATANDVSEIPSPLRDRMEIIQLSGYSTEEKIEIAKRHLITKQLTNHGLKKNQVELDDKVLEQLIENYTRESGVRELDRQLASVMRAYAKKIAMKEKFSKKISPDDLTKVLGIKKFDKEKYQEAIPAGVAIGLAWTLVGGEILFVETSLSKGKGNVTITGNLGNVMKESASTALSFLKAHCEDLKINPAKLKESDIHIHVPEGAIPKDGPSAGVTMLTSLASSFTEKKIKPFLAMTGEITLRGKVLPVGGIKEKILAAKRSGMKEVILCKENKKDVDEIKQQFIAGLKFHYVEKMIDVVKAALMK